MLTQHIFTNAKLLISHSLAYGHQYIVFVGPQQKKPYASPSHTPPCVYKTINLRGHFYDNSFIYFFFRSSLSSWWLWFLAVAAACKYTARTSGHRHTYNIYIYRYMQCRACAECCWLAVCVRCSPSITGRSTNMLNEKINKTKHSPIDAFTIYALAICIFSTNHSAFLQYYKVKYQSKVWWRMKIREKKLFELHFNGEILPKISIKMNGK